MWWTLGDGVHHSGSPPLTSDAVVGCDVVVNLVNLFPP